MMSKKINDPNWAARQRLRYIEACAWWKGTVSRNDLSAIFSISTAQASADLQAYLEMNPTAMSYNMRQKRYEAAATMAWVLVRPRLEEAVALFAEGGGDAPEPCPQGGTPVLSNGAWSVVRIPACEVRETVERRAFLAIMNDYRIRMRFINPQSGKDEWRRIRPHALGSDGCRWHLRAWCERCDDFLDFPLHRITEIEWTRDRMDLPRPDHEWDTWVTLTVRPHHSLDPLARQAMELDFHMTDGVCRLQLRKAMECYVRMRLGLPGVPGDEPLSAPMLEVVEPAGS